MSIRPPHKSIFPQSLYGITIVALFSLLSLGLGIVALRVNPKSGIAPEGSLLEASGRLAGMKEYKYGVRFGLIGVTEKFDYSDKAGAIAAVNASLEGLSSQTLTVRYDAQTHSRPDSKYIYHNVWALAVGSRNLRTYAETATAWEKDNRIGPRVGWIFVGCGLILGYVAWQSYRRSSRSA